MFDPMTDPTIAAYVEANDADTRALIRLARMQESRMAQLRADVREAENAGQADAPRTKWLREYLENLELATSLRDAGVEIEPDEDVPAPRGLTILEGADPEGDN